MARKHPQEELKPEAPKMDPKLKEALEAHGLNADKIVLSVLGDCLGADLKFYDVNYILQRIAKILLDSFNTVDFIDNELSRLKKAYFIRKANELSRGLKIPLDMDPNSREAKCEPVCHKIIADIVDSDFLENDSKWLDQYMNATNAAFVMDLLKHYTDTVSSKLDFSLTKSYVECEKILFGVPKSNLTLKQIDQILKSNNPVEKIGKV